MTRLALALAVLAVLFALAATWLGFRWLGNPEPAYLDEPWGDR